jgi:hypothetical protein
MNMGSQQYALDLFGNPLAVKITLSCSQSLSEDGTSAVWRLFAQVDFGREMRPIAFVDPGAFLVPNPGQISQNRTSGETVKFHSSGKCVNGPERQATYANYRRTRAANGGGGTRSAGAM